MNWISDWWKKWFGTGTPDDWRNPFWRLTEWLKITPEWSRYLIDVRLGFKRDNKWKSLISFWSPVTQNFWNGIFSFNIYFVKAKIWKTNIPFLFPRFNLVIRPLHDQWFETGVGFLFDRGEFGIKFVIMNWKGEGGIDAQGWDEGSV